MKLPSYTEIRRFLYSSDPITWAAHAGQGFAVMAVFDATFGRGAGLLALTYHGIAREGEGLYDAGARRDTRKIRDGIFDLMAFYFGAALYAFVANFQ